MPLLFLKKQNKTNLPNLQTGMCFIYNPVPGELLADHVLPAGLACKTISKGV